LILNGTDRSQAFGNHLKNYVMHEWYRVPKGHVTDSIIARFWDYSLPLFIAYCSLNDL